VEKESRVGRKKLKIGNAKEKLNLSSGEERGRI